MAERIHPGMTKKTGASLARHRSKQDIGTPPEFIEAIERRFGKLGYDLAAAADNTVCSKWLGPGSILGENSLVVDWSKLRANCWLNPPFGKIEPWATKMANERRDLPYFSAFLVPAATGANWFQIHCVPNSLILELTDRITFVGSKDGYPKDLVCCVFGFGLVGRMSWHWDQSVTKAYQRTLKLKAAQAAE